MDPSRATPGAAADATPFLGYGDPAIPHRTDTGAGTLRIYSSWPAGERGGGPGRDAAAAIRLALDLAGGAAGGFALDYVPLGDATPAYPDVWDAATEIANAGRAVADPAAVAYIGGGAGGALAQSLPIVQGADRPLVALSAAATWPGLTRCVAAVTPRHEPGQYAPGGRTTFVRLAPADDRQGEALAALAVAEGRQTVAVFHDGGPYGRALALPFAAAFAASGGRVSRVEALPADPTPFARQLAAVRDDGADGVVIGGVASPALATLIGRLVAEGTIPPGAILGGDGLIADDLLRVAAEAAGGPVDGLTALGPPRAGDWPGGDAWRAAFLPGRTADGAADGEPDPFAAHAFDAAVALVQAIDAAGSADPVAIRAALGALAGFAGVTGPVAVGPEGDRLTGTFRVARVRDGAFRTVRLLDR